LVPLVLDHNLRNTRQIATAFQPLVDSPMRYMGGNGPEVSFVPAPPPKRWMSAMTRLTRYSKTAGGQRTSRC
jgi:hypothetical protein